MTYPLLLIGITLGNLGKSKLIVIQLGKIVVDATAIMSWVARYWSTRMEYCARPNLGTKGLGPSHKCIRMELLESKAVLSLND